MLSQAQVSVTNTTFLKCSFANLTDVTQLNAKSDSLLNPKNTLGDIFDFVELDAKLYSAVSIITFLNFV